MGFKSIALVIIYPVVFILEHVYPNYFPRPRHIRHSAYNLSVGLLNGLIGLFIISVVNLRLSDIISLNNFGLLNLRVLPYFLRIILAFLLFDLWMYIWHLADHRVPLLWLFHRSHHNDPEMDGSTALRFHPVEIIISGVLRLPVFILLGMNITALSIYETVFLGCILFHHSNIYLPAPVDRFIRIFIVTPDMHRMHHSVKKINLNSNFSSILSFWDRIFGTFKKWGDTRLVKIGLTDYREEKWQRPLGILALPFKGLDETG